MQLGQLKRREFIKLFGGAAIAWASGAHAQEMRRVGALLPFGDGDPAVNGWIKAFQDELQRLGWEQGRNIQIEYRLAGTDVNRLRTEAAELVRLNPEMLFTAGTS